MRLFDPTSSSFLDLAEISETLYEECLLELNSCDPKDQEEWMALASMCEADARAFHTLDEMEESYGLLAA